MVEAELLLTALLGAMRPDLLAIIHPWTTAPGRIDAPARTAEQEYELCTACCSLFINARTLREFEGFVVVVPPVGHVVMMFSPPVITGDNMRMDLRIMPKNERYAANMLCLSVPFAAVQMTSCPVTTFFVDDVDGAQGNPFELRRHRMGVRIGWGLRILHIVWQRQLSSQLASEFAAWAQSVTSKKWLWAAFLLTMVLSPTPPLLSCLGRATGVLDLSALF